jgi:hypothetical protein
MYMLQSTSTNVDDGRDRNAMNGREMRLRRATIYIGKDPVINVKKIFMMTSSKSVSSVMLVRRRTRKVTTGIATITREQDRHVHISPVVGKSEVHAVQ